MTGIVNSTGAKSGIIGTTVGTPASTTVEVFYHTRSIANYPILKGLDYPLSGNMESVAARTTGIIPATMSSIADMHFWFYSDEAGTQTVQMRWQLAGNGEAQNQHTLALTTIWGTASQADKYLYKASCMNRGAGGSYFEQLAVASDTFAMGFSSTGGSAACYGLGVLIKYVL